MQGFSVQGKRVLVSVRGEEARVFVELYWVAADRMDTFTFNRFKLGAMTVLPPKARMVVLAHTERMNNGDSENFSSLPMKSFHVRSSDIVSQKPTGAEEATAAAKAAEEAAVAKAAEEAAAAAKAAEEAAVAKAAEEAAAAAKAAEEAAAAKAAEEAAAAKAAEEAAAAVKAAEEAAAAKAAEEAAAAVKAAEEAAAVKAAEEAAAAKAAEEAAAAAKAAEEAAAAKAAEEAAAAKAAEEAAAAKAVEEAAAAAKTAEECDTVAIAALACSTESDAQQAQQTQQTFTEDQVEAMKELAVAAATAQLEERYKLETSMLVNQLELLQSRADADAVEAGQLKRKIKDYEAVMGAFWLLLLCTVPSVRPHHNYNRLSRRVRGNLRGS